MIACSASLVFVWVIAKKTRAARASICPLRSMAARVLSNVGASGRLAIASISASCCRMPSWMAGS